jgi:AcrR family transcriptional regulator
MLGSSVSAVKGRRTYTSPLRESQVRATRQAILQAARELFVAQGYGATTVDQIAQRAGVSKPTVFSAVGNKQTVLRAVRDVAIAGDDEPVPVAQRPLLDRVRAAPDQRRVVAMMAAHLTAVAGRYAEINEVVHAAADAGEEGLRDLWSTEEEERLTSARLWLQLLTDKGGLRRGLSTPEAVDVLWLLMSPDQYYRLVHGRGWSPRRYERWLAAAIGRLLVRES